MNRINPIPHIDIYISLRYILILFSHLHLSLPKHLFPVGVPVKILKTLLPYSTLATWPSHFNHLDLIIMTVLGERYKLCSSSLWSILHSPFTSLVGPNICLRILFSRTHSLRSSLNVREHASQPYSTTGNVILRSYNNKKLIKRGRRVWHLPDSCLYIST